MIKWLGKRANFIRGFVFLSPRITLLGICGVLLLAAMIVLGTVILRQVEANRAAMGFNFSTANRPFSQLEHEVLQLLVYVTSRPDPLDPEQFQADLDVLASRWEVVFWPSIQAVFPQEIKNNVEEMRPMWDDIQTLSANWLAEPDNEAVRAELADLLNRFSLLVFQTDIRYQSFRGVILSGINESSQSLLIALGVVSLLLVGFVVIGALSIARFLQEQKIAETRTREALAAQKAALETSRFKDQFLAIMSHELRTPLNAIIGFLGILNMTSQFDERQTHMLHRIRTNSERLLVLINDILDLSKIESGRLELAPMPVSLRDLAQRWQFQMEVLAKQKDLRFSVNIDSLLPEHILIDEDALTKVATNLLSNAFKFTEKGDVTLSLKRNQQLWMLEVQDSGIGIPAHMFDHIFESFRQIDGSSTRNYGGTGLGLSIVQHLVKAMNGTVQVQSEVGKGSTFTVTLPLAVAAAAPQ
jgi:signal transduction histidine kinase